MKKSLIPEVLDVAHSILEGLDCAHSLSASLLIKYGEWDQLVQKTCDPRSFLTAEDYMCANAATELLRKFPDLPTTLDLDAITLEKWWWAERECFRTNRRLDAYIDRGSACGDSDDGRILSFIGEVRKNIEKIIGSGPPPTWEGRFGPGATVSDVSTAVTTADKMSSVPTFTPNALFHLVPWTGTWWAKASAALGRSPQSVRGNSYFTVPKDSKSHRACGKEPSINVFYQLGLGRVLRERLKSSGINLNSGQDVHKQVACVGSHTDEFCTIDLTSASDCMSTALVELLLPHRWHSALSALRSPFTEVDGRWVRLEKFSSMGNGFTFELETVIFLGISLTCMNQAGQPRRNVFTYGDDIIVPKEFGSAVVSALKWFGFTPNPKKTFLEGNFRESCGGDYFNGVSVRAHNIEKDPHEPQDYISLANGVNRIIRQDGLDSARKRTLRRAWFRILDRIPTAVRRCRGPEWLGDLVIHDEECRWETRWRGQLRYVKVFRPVSFPEVRFDGFAYDVMFAACLYGVFLHRPRGKPGKRLQSHDWDGRVFHTRGDVSGYKVGWTNCP